MRLPSKRARRGFERSERAHRGIARGERVLKYGRVRRLSAYGSRHMHLFEGTRACYCLREPPRFLIIGLESVHNNRHSPHNFEDLLGFSTSVPKQCERAARGGDGGQGATTPRRGTNGRTHTVLILQIAKQGCHALEISRRGLKAIATDRERLTHFSDDGCRAPRRSGSAADALDFVLALLLGHGERVQRHAQCSRAGAVREGGHLCPRQRLRRHERMSRSDRQQAAPQPAHGMRTRPWP